MDNVIAIKAGETKGIEIVVSPLVPTSEGTLTFRPGIPTCNDVNGTDIKCQNLNISGVFSESRIAPADKALTSQKYSLEISVPKNSPVGRYPYVVDASTYANIPKPGSVPVHVGFSTLFTIEVQ